MQAAVTAGAIYSAGTTQVTVHPMMDFEGYSEAGFRWDPLLNKWGRLFGAPPSQSKGLEAVGTKAWVNHPSFEVLSLAYDLLDGRGVRRWVPPKDLQPIASGDRRHPFELLEHIAAGRPIEAWYVAMEYTVWNDYCVRVWGWPMLAIEQLHCASAKSRAHAMPGALEDAGEVQRVPVQKDKDGKRLLKKFSIPRDPTKTDKRLRIRPEDDPQDFERLVSYNATDCYAELSCSLLTPDLSPCEREIWETDQKVNARGIGVDLEDLDNCIAIVEQAERKYTDELRALTRNAATGCSAVTSASQLEQMKTWALTQNVYLHSLAEEALAEYLESDVVKAVPQVHRMLQIRSKLAAASVKKLYAFKNQNYNGRVYWLYTYFAARTGRWTGNGPQPQNLYKGSLGAIEEVEKALAVISFRSLEMVEAMYGDALEAVASCLRSLLVAAPGHELVCSDFSAIEGVVAAALAGEEWRLEVFRTHRMIYEASAARICGVPFQEFVDHRLRTGGIAKYNAAGQLIGIKGGKHHPLRAKIGKFAELSLGFGGWTGAMVGFGADEFLSEPEMVEAALGWRAASPNIVEMWGGQTRKRRTPEGWQISREYYGLEGAAVQAMLNPGQAFVYRNCVYQLHNDALYCRPPDGGLITYHRPRLSPSTRDRAQPWELELTYEGWNTNPKNGPYGWIRMKLYGGKLFENIVQHVARYFQARAMVRLERAGYRPVLHSHDEIAGEVPVGWGSVEEFEEIANQGEGEEWARGWPILMKGGWRGRRYRKED